MPLREHVGMDPERLEAVRLRRLFDQLPALIGYWDQDLHNVMANHAYIEWFGLSPDEIRGLHIRDVLGEEVYQKNLPFIRGVLAGKEQLFSRTLVDPTGRTRHSQASYVPEVIDGKVIGFFALVTDVTPRVEAQRQLDDAQELAKVGSWVYYPRTGELTWSREMFRLVDRDPETAPSVDAYVDLVHPDDREIALAQKDALSTLKEEYELHYRLLLPSGEVRYLHSRARPEFDAQGVLSRVTGTAQDETERQLTAAELSRTNQELTNVNQALADTIALLGHDVRQPIQTISGFLELMSARWDSAEPAVLRDYLERALTTTMQMNALVDDVLMLVNVDSGVLATRPSRVELSGLVREAVQAAAPGVDVVLHLREGAVAHADPFHLRQVLTNLVANAIRYGREPITVTTAPDGDGVHITVADTGEGVPADFVPILFDRFSRAATGVASTKAGSGFGLYIVKQLVEANGGTIGYAAVEPTGASFTVTLPCPEPPD